MKKIFFFLFFLLPFNTSSSADLPSVQVRMEVNPKEMTIGDPVQVQVTVVFDPTLIPGPLSLPDPLGKFELTNLNTSVPKPTSDQKMEQTHTLFVTTFSTGMVSFPALSLTFINKKGQASEAVTTPVSINVISMLEKMGDQGGLRPLKGFFNFKSYLWIAWVGIAILLLVMGFLIWKWKSKKHFIVQKPFVPLRPPEETIWDVIHNLEDSNLISEGKVKEFYSALSTAFRIYLEQRFQISALDRTTSELLTELRSKKIGSDTTTILKLFQESSDLVKFAKLTPEENEIYEDLERVKQFVHMTTPQKEELLKVEQKEEIPV